METAEQFVKEGNRLLQSGKHEQAIEKYKQAIKIKNDYAQAFNSWGFALAQLAKQKKGEDADTLFQKAFDKYNKASVLNSKATQIFDNWGWALQQFAHKKQGKQFEDLLKQAFDKYNNAVNIDPYNITALYHWAEALTELAHQEENKETEKLLEQACEKYRKVTELAPNHTIAFNNYGTVLQELSDYKHGQEAKELLRIASNQYKQAIKLNIDPKYIDPVLNCCNVLARLLKYKTGQEAESLYQTINNQYQTIVKFNFTNAIIFYNWGIFLENYANRKTGEEAKSLYKEACILYKQAIRLDSNLYSAYLQLGRSLVALADKTQEGEAESLYEEACFAYENAHKISSTNFDLFFNWGISLKKLADLKTGKEAEQLYEKSINIQLKYKEFNLFQYQNLHEVHLNLGSTFTDFADTKDSIEKEYFYQEAIKEYQKAKEINLNSFLLFYDWGILLYKYSGYKKRVNQTEIAEKLCQEAIYQLKRAISLDNHLILSYLYISICYFRVHQYLQAFKHVNIYLYLLINNNSKVTSLTGVIQILSFDSQHLNILSLLDTVGVRLDNYLNQYIPHILAAKKQTKLHSFPLYLFLEDVNFNTLLNNPFENAFDTIKDFLYLCEYFIHTGQLNESTLAVMYFYLGGIVKSYKLYDEVLDMNEKYRLTARDYYYYAKCTNFISLERQAVLNDCIKNCPQNNNIDLYYLAHLYWLNGDKESATSLFYQSKDFEYSSLLFEFLTTAKVNYKLTNNTQILSTEFITFEEQFTAFCHLKECSDIIHEKGGHLLFQEIWEYFTIDREQLYLKKRQFEMSFLEAKLAELTGKSFDKMTIPAILTDDNNNGWNNQYDRMTFFQLKDDIKKLKNNKCNNPNLKTIEDLIAHQIENLRQENTTLLYHHIIVLFYQQQDITKNEALQLHTYLLFVLKKKKQENTNRFMVDLVSKFHVVGSLLSLSLKAYDIFISMQKTYYTTSETLEYRLFKADFWKYISSLEATESEKDFKKYFGLD